MNHRTTLIILGAGGLIGLFQWRQHREIAAQESSLRKEIARFKSLPLATTTGRLDKSTPPSSEQAATAFDPAKFVASLENLAPYLDQHGQPSDLSAQVELQELAPRIIAQMTRASADQLKLACESLLCSKASPDQTTDELAQPLLARIAESDPAWAAAHAMKLKKNGLVLRNIFEVWFRQDSSVAQAWLDAAEKDGSLPLSLREVAAMRTLAAAGQGAGDPSGALERLPTMSPEAARQAAGAMAIALKTPAARTTTLQRIATLTDASTVEHFALGLAASAGFEAARDTLAIAKLSPEMNEAAAIAIARQSIGPRSAEHATWLLANAAGISSKPVCSFVQAWTRADFNAAATWLKAQPASDRRDEMVNTFAQEITPAEPASAADWAATIANSELRTGALQHVWTAWYASDAAAATAYFREKNLPLPTSAH